jgi:flavin reductase (DIM6/NTAB) family NADH-FMN oxidoreductase RutF
MSHLNADKSSLAKRPLLTHAMRFMAGPVCVVTAGLGNERTGATVTTAHSLSVDPEMMVVSINVNSSTYTAIATHRHFCVNILAADQREIADRFAGRGGLKGVARYDGAEWHTLKSGALGLDGALAVIDCTVDEMLMRHSHALILGRVEAIELGGDGHSLIYRSGKYGAYSEPVHWSR